MPDELLNTADAAKRLGISRASLYAWLAESDTGSFEIQGQPVTIQYYQTGRRGQGHIRIEVEEIERLRDLMRVRPHRQPQRPPPVKLSEFPGITVKLGRPRD